AGLGLNVLAALGLGLALTNFALVDAVGASAAVKRLRGWEELARSATATARGYDAILVDDRETMSAMLFYGRGGPRVVALNSNGYANNYYEAAMAYDPARDRRVVFVTKHDAPLGADVRYERVRLLGVAEAAIGRGKSRRLHFFEAIEPSAR
ncbi:MAG: hypothetical protein K2Q06_07710, partial [Parvularculaceae bacterium]|nr:hypothetical protein [Parvularculaceae bacterium]